MFRESKEQLLKDEAVRKRAKEVCRSGSFIAVAGLALLICYRLTGHGHFSGIDWLFMSRVWNDSGSGCDLRWQLCQSLAVQRAIIDPAPSTGTSIRQLALLSREKRSFSSEKSFS